MVLGLENNIQTFIKKTNKGSRMFLYETKQKLSKTGLFYTMYSSIIGPINETEAASDTYMKHAHIITTRLDCTSLQA